MRPTIARMVVVNDKGNEIPAVVNAVHGDAGDSQHGEYHCISVMAFPFAGTPRPVTSIYLFGSKATACAYQDAQKHADFCPAVAYWPERVPA